MAISIKYVSQKAAQQLDTTCASQNSIASMKRKRFSQLTVIVFVTSKKGHYFIVLSHGMREDKNRIRLVQIIAYECAIIQLEQLLASKEAYDTTSLNAM